MLKETSVIALELLSDELVHFDQDRGTPILSNSFRRLLKTEIPPAKEHAEKEFDWDAIPNFTSY